jgi:hypothetical protein
MIRYPKPPKKLEERFDLSGFLGYLQQTFQGFDNSFLRETVEKIVWNAHFFNFQLSNTWIAFYIKEHLPDEVQLSEIMKFVLKD